MYETIIVSIHKKEKNKTVWQVLDSETTKFIDVDVGKDDMDRAMIVAINTLGEDGWFLSTQPIYYRMFMQRLRK